MVEPGWSTLGGTSLASPLIAATFALAGGSNGVAYPAETLYAHEGGSGLHDIVEGSNGWCGGELICNAAKGYDGPTGVGTPNGISAFIPVPGVLSPIVTGLTPAGGASAGGTSVTITGSNLAAASAVKFGGTPATIISDSANSITAISPAHAGGVVDVTVTGHSGATSAESSADRFDYVVAAPSVSSVSPDEGTTSGGSTVTIDGSGLGEAEQVEFGGVAATIVGRGGESLSVTSPQHGAGTVDVTVKSRDGASSPVSPGDRFTYVDSGTLRMSDVSLTPRVFAIGQSPKLHVTLSAAATVIVSINQAGPGHMVNGRCIRTKRRRATCSATVRKLTLRLPAVAGVNVFRLSLTGLKAGSYVATITAQTAKGSSSGSVAVRFTVRNRTSRA